MAELGRRGVIALLSAAVLAEAQKMPNTPEGQSLWNVFADEWNAMATRLREGVFDGRQWKRVCAAFRHLEDKHGCAS